MRKLGYTDTDLWMVLAWIRELAPIIVHINLDKAQVFKSVVYGGVEKLLWRWGRVWGVWR